MKRPAFFSLVFFLLLLLPLRAQDDVDLFGYWKYYSDIGNSLYKTSCSLAFKQLQKREQAIARLQTRTDVLQRQEQIKKKLLRLFGPFPPKTPLNPRITGVINKKHYRVEKVIYESLPGYYVTAALFIPEKIIGKAPAIIYASGHTKEGFRNPTYQHIIINLVRKGFVVLAFDPIGQGERLQYYDEKTGKSPFGPTIEHSYPGAQCFLSGYSPAKYFVWDGIRSVDYLLTRKEVDPARIGITGRSGGGTQTAYIAAVDDRILAAAPECYITKMEYIFKSIGPQDAEQNLMHFVSEGLDHADLLEVRAPRPTLVITTTRDFFSIQGARETCREAKRFYEMLGAGDRINRVEDDTVHASTRKNREAMYAFFQKVLNNPGSPEDLDVETFDEKELWVTETGQLATSLKSRTLFSLNKKIAENRFARLKLSRAKEDFSEHAAAVIAAAKRWSGFEAPVTYGKPVFSGRYVRKDYTLEKYLIPGSGRYVLPAVLFIPAVKNRREIVLLADEKGMNHAAAKDPLAHLLLKQGYSVLLFDLPGIGSMGPGYLKGDAYINNISYNQWFAAILTGKSIVGLRAEDIARMVHFAKTVLKGYDTISAVACGTVGSEMLHAAAFDDNIRKVCLLHPFLSFAEIARTHNYAPAFIPSTVAGAIEDYDLTDLAATLCPRKLLIVNPLAANGKPFADQNKSCFPVYPQIVYARKGMAKNFRYLPVTEKEREYDAILKWLQAE